MWINFARLLAAIMVTATLSAGAVAQTFNEVGDAGQTLATAQAVPGGVTTIQGNTQSPGDVDLYRFSVTTAGSVTITAWGADAAPSCPPYPTIDANLILFNGAGVPLWGDDDGDPAHCYGSQIVMNLAAGNYYVAFGENNIEAMGPIDEYICGNDDAACTDAVTPLHHFLADGDATGAYTITFSQPTGGSPSKVAAVPGPTGIILLPLLAVMGIAGASRLKRRA